MFVQTILAQDRLTQNTLVWSVWATLIFAVQGVSTLPAASGPFMSAMGRGKGRGIPGFVIKPVLKPGLIIKAQPKLALKPAPKPSTSFNFLLLFFFLLPFSFLQLPSASFDPIWLLLSTFELEKNASMSSSTFSSSSWICIMMFLGAVPICFPNSLPRGRPSSSFRLSSPFNPSGSGRRFTYRCIIHSITIILLLSRATIHNSPAWVTSETFLTSRPCALTMDERFSCSRRQYPFCPPPSSSFWWRFALPRPCHALSFVAAESLLGIPLKRPLQPSIFLSLSLFVSSLSLLCIMYSTTTI